MTPFQFSLLPMLRARLLAIVLLVGFFSPVAQGADWNYHFSGGISRAEFVSLALASVSGQRLDGTNCFPDVTTESFAPSVCAAKVRGIISGRADGLFYPYDSISLVEAAAIVVRAKNVSVGSDFVWYRPYLEKLSQWNAIPRSVQNILQPLSYSQAQELIDAAIDERDDEDEDDEDDDEAEDDNDDDDLDLTVSASDETVEENDRVTYRIRVKNTDSKTRNIDIVAELPDDLRFISTSDDGDYDSGDDEVSWDSLRVKEDETKTVLLTLQVDDGVDEGDRLRLEVTASVKSEESTVTQTIKVTDDSDEDGDLRLSITDSDDPVEEGEYVTYTIRLENQDNDDMNVDVSADLDEAMDFVSASNDGEEDDDVVEWTDIDLDEDEDKKITLVVRVNSKADEGDKLKLRVRANEEDDIEETRVDENTDDDDEDINVSITDSDDPVEEGDLVTYRIKLENNDNRDVTIDAKAELDEGMTFYSATYDGDDVSGGDEVEWDNLFIEEDETLTLLLLVRINSDVDDGDILQLKVTAGDGKDTETTKVED